MRGTLRRVWLAVLTGAALVGAGQAATAGAPQRIVSLNLCTDQILVDLVGRERIAGLSFVAADRTVSAIADRVGDTPLVRGAAEEVLALRPDLVVTTPYSTIATVALLERLGVPVVRIPLATDLEGIRSAIRQLAGAVAEPERGEALIATFDARLAAARPRSDRRATALLYQSNGVVSGPESLIAAGFAAAGLRNVAVDYPLGRGGRIALETIVAAPPDVIVLAHGPGDFATAVADNLRHPALAHVLQQRPSIVLPMPLWLCGTHHVATAIEALAATRRRLAP